LNLEQLRAISKAEIPQLSKSLTVADVKLLVETLNEKNDELRYTSLLLLQAKSKIDSSVSAHWSVLEEKLDSNNSYQRSIGVMLLSENVRWETDDRFGRLLCKFWTCCCDEKFITARQTIQALTNIMKSTDKYNNAIKQGLLKLNFNKYKNNQQSLLERDVAAALKHLKSS
jgi:hypothetical protein